MIFDSYYDLIQLNIQPTLKPHKHSLFTPLNHQTPPHPQKMHTHSTHPHHLPQRPSPREMHTRDPALESQVGR